MVELEIKMLEQECISKLWHLFSVLCFTPFAVILGLTVPFFKRIKHPNALQK